MTVFSASQLPTGGRATDTVEKLILWGAYILRRFTVKTTFLRTVGLAEESICSVSRFTDADGINRVQIVVILPETDTVDQNLADWVTVGSIATTAIPTSFTG